MLDESNDLPIEFLSLLPIMIAMLGFTAMEKENDQTPPRARLHLHSMKNWSKMINRTALHRLKLALCHAGPPASDNLCIVCHRDCQPLLQA